MGNTALFLRVVWTHAHTAAHLFRDAFRPIICDYYTVKRMNDFANNETIFLANLQLEESVALLLYVVHIHIIIILLTICIILLSLTLKDTPTYRKNYMETNCST